ncbi:M15 family metallopeptidase [Alteribacillus sp. YIM 98480]|uniref:M15 family metallopeptidase n=1 Tax=Alteribacillus sp. YIM 98480 TaxID=2606599 RepID=UPI00351BBBDB
MRTNAGWDMTLLFLFGAALFFFWPKEKTEEVTPEELTELTELHPIVEEKKNKLLRRSEERGINVVITEGYRTLEEQNNLYEKGRSQPGSVVTNAQGGESYHNYGLAIDFAINRRWRNNVEY